MSAVFSAVSNYVQEQAWVFMALAVAVFWGMHYSTLDHVVQDRSPWTVLFWPAIFALVGQLGFGAKDIYSDSVQIFQSWRDILVLLFLCLTAFGANTLGVYAIQAKNALLAGFIEISYPLFTGLFAWLFFGNFQFTKYNILGGLCILAGVMFISLGEQLEPDQPTMPDMDDESVITTDLVTDDSAEDGTLVMESSSDGVDDLDSPPPPPAPNGAPMFEMSSMASLLMEDEEASDTPST